ncbi:MAG: fibronectin type III domain-containing protein [Planctomycetota bacterium]|nr:MAG: fibronectin type III domain-containing protein [Planctomycetota bacterium]
MTRRRLVPPFALFLLLGGGLAAFSGCGPTAAYGAYALKERHDKKKERRRRRRAATAVSPHDARLSWTPPTHRVDGSPLGSDLAGYKVYYGTRSRTYTTVVDIPNPLTTQHLIENLPPGRWYFAVSAYDRQGLESGYSNEADKFIQ